MQIVDRWFNHLHCLTILNSLVDLLCTFAWPLSCRLATILQNKLSLTIMGYIHRQEEVGQLIIFVRSTSALNSMKKAKLLDIGECVLNSNALLRCNDERATYFTNQTYILLALGFCVLA